MYKVEIFEIDFTNKIIEISKLNNNIPIPGDLLLNEIEYFEVDNRDNQFDIKNPASMFYSDDLIKFNVNIYLYNVLVYKGYIKNIVSDNKEKTARVELYSEFYKLVNQSIVWVNSAIYTPSYYIKIICDIYSIPIDPVTCAIASEYEFNNGDFIKINAPVPNNTILNIFQEICSIALIGLYIQNGLIKLYKFIPVKPEPVVIFSDDDLDYKILTPINFEIIEKDIAKGFSVEWEGGVVESGDFNHGKRISASGNNSVIINSQQTAISIGLQWLSYLNTKSEKVIFSISSSVSKFLELGMPIGFKINNFQINIIISSIDFINKIETKIEGITY